MRRRDRTDIALHAPTTQQVADVVAVHEAWLARGGFNGASGRAVDAPVKAVMAAWDLSDQDLSGALLRGADLRCADLSGADLSDADLRGATLDFADLREPTSRRRALRARR